MNSSIAGNKNAIFNHYEIFYSSRLSFIDFSKLIDIKYSFALHRNHEESSHYKFLRITCRKINEQPSMGHPYHRKK